MITKSRFAMMTVTVLVVFALSAMWTVPAFADDTTPPPTETPTEVTPPAEEETVEAPPAEPAAESAVVEDEAAPVQEPALQEETVAELLAQVPQGTDLVVTDANGEALPLASTEAAEAIEFVDPIWCPTGVTPTASVGGCSASFTNLANLITGFIPTGNGVIWIQAGADSTAPGTALLINGAGNWAAASSFSLGLQGGWSGTMGTTTIDTETPSIFDQSLSIINWNAAVSLSDIVLDGVTSNPNSGGFENSALLVDTTGNIQLDRVTVKNSAGVGVLNGATLDNSLGAASSVSVNNGRFEKNEADGLHIYSAGIVTITSLYANANDQDGAVINNSFAASDLAVTLSGAQEYGGNGSGAGLIVISNGFVTISNVIANGNGGNGVDIDNHTSLTGQGVTVAGTNMFNDNGIGLKVLSHGVITTYNIFASGNGADGVVLDNCDDSGGCNTLGAPYVYIAGYNYFYDNGALTGGDGLNVSTFGQIMAYNLTSSYNQGHGARLDNQHTNLAASDSEAGITLYGLNVFNNNFEDGLNVTSHGDFVAYSNLTANENVGNGVSLTVQKDQPTVVYYRARVKVSGKYRYVTKYYYVTEANIVLYGPNKFDGNSLDGLNVSADGTVTLYNISAYFNGENGADLTTTTEGYGINLYGANSFIENGSCACDAGLLINSTGAVTLYDIAANGNFGDGVNIDNSASLNGYGVNLYGANMFNFNDGIGLNVLSHGIITTYNLSASDNGADGVVLDNCDDSGGCTAPGAPYVALYGNNYFYYNGALVGGDGLNVSTFGQIIAYNLTASFNNGNGARLDNQLFSTAAFESVGAIALYGNNVFNVNSDDGLNATSSGDIVAYNLTADHNVEYGASLTATKTQDSWGSYKTRVRVKVGGRYVYKYVTTYYIISAANVSLYGNNNFNGNDTGDGLYVSTDGAITVYNLTANGNGQGAALGVGNGATLDNCTISTGSCSSGTEVNPVNVYGYVNVSDNNWRGLQVSSLGAVNLSNIIASGNLGVGARVDNRFNASINPAIVRGVTISGTNIFNGNDSTGLAVLSYGAITLNDINAYYNGDSTPGTTSGVFLDNRIDPGVVAKDITMTGVNSFIGNFYRGLEFHSDATVTLAHISANGNDAGPGDVNNGAGVVGTAYNISITCGHMFGNGVNDPARGYDLAATNALSLYGIYSAGNSASDIGTGASVVKIQACALP